MGANSSKVASPSSESHLSAKMASMKVDGESGTINEKMSRVLHREPEGLSIQTMESWQSEILKDSTNRLALVALADANPSNVFKSTPTVISDQQVFNVKIPFEGGPVTNQHSSGRCWLFASTNIFRIALMRRYNLESFQLSQSYLFFWDKLEKANWFLEQIIDTASEDLDSRTVQHLLGSIVPDGGQWDMVFNLIEKYGLVPQALYPDRWSARNSSVLNTVLETKLREFALRLRSMCEDHSVASRTLSSAKSDMMADVLRVLTITLGPPPNPDESFTWQFNSKDGKAHSVTATPRDFSKDIYSSDVRVNHETVGSMVPLVHDPRHEPLTLMTVSRVGNMVGGRPITYLNVDMDTLKKACVSMLRAGLPVFFGNDVRQHTDRATGVMDLNIVDWELGLGVDLMRMDKKSRMMVRESYSSHAMVLTAVQVDDDGNTVRWRVQNSWGTETGDDGWYVMSDAWMDEFVFEAVIDPRFLSKRVRDVLKKDPVVLPPWDVMGLLA